MVTEGIERFNKIVMLLGLYVDQNSQEILNDPERMKHEPVMAYVNEESFLNNSGYILSMIDECVYACLETVEDMQDSLGNKDFVFIPKETSRLVDGRFLKCKNHFTKPNIDKTEN